MKISFGFVSQALSMWEGSPSKTLTFTRYAQMKKAERKEKLLSVTAQNIETSRRIIMFCIGHNIPLYRFSSAIVPLATHPEAKWDFIRPFKKEWKEIGRLVRENSMKVSFHPNQFTLFTSDKEHITDNAVLDMIYHYDMLKAMGLEENGLLNIHVGGAYGDKETALVRFYENIKKLPDHVRERMTLENDDKTYNSWETLEVCERIGVPLLFDYHHHMANGGTPLEVDKILERAFDTWAKWDRPLKVHLSSPKAYVDKDFRSHADNVEVEFILPFLSAARSLGRDFDVMIESKAKDKALFLLMEELGKLRGVKRVGGATLEWK